jgi:HK97 family phage major capsid protein
MPPHRFQSRADLADWREDAQLEREIAALSDVDLGTALTDALGREATHMAEAQKCFDSGETSGWTDGRRSAFDAYQTGEGRIQGEISALRRESNRRAVGAAARKPGAVEGPYTPAKTRTTPMNTLTGGVDYLALASDAIDRVVLSPKRQTELDGIIRAESAIGITPNARLIAATSSPAYATGFTKVVSDPTRAPFLLSPEERQAMAEATDAARFLAMTTGTSTDGGWLLPSPIDPTIQLSSDGATNPIRSIAQIRTLTQKTLRLVTSDGVTASYGAEGSTIAKSTPTFAGPELKAERGTAYLELSFEMVADWAGAPGELVRLFSDAKQNLEAELFLQGLGAASNEPEGLLHALFAYDAAPTTVDDLIDGQAELPARFQQNARWLMALASINGIGQFVAEGDTNNAKIFDANGDLLHKPVVEASYARTDVVYGDFRAGFAIGDRLGMSVEPTGVVYDKDAQVPSGYRGFLAIWRSGSKLLIPEAFVLLGAGGS